MSRVHCPGPIGCCSPVCPLGVLCCCVVSRATGHLFTWCARSVCCVVFTVSWAPWLLFSRVLAQPVVWRARCPRPLGSCSPVCSLGVLCCVFCVRCTRPLGPCSPVCALGVLCGASLRGAHSFIRTAAIRSQQGLCTLWERTRPSGQRLISSRQGLGILPGAHGGWPTSIPTRTIRAAWPHYGVVGGDEVKAAYTRQTALLLHRMSLKHSPEVREVATIRLQAAQQARNTCPRWILYHTGMPTSINTRLRNHLQLLVPSPHHAILTKHICPEEGPLAVLCGDLHHHPKGTIDTRDLVGASITVVYVTLPRMWVLHRSGAHHTAFLQLPQCPQYRLLRQYLTETARATGHTLPGSQDMVAAYRDFKKQQPCLVPATPPYTPTGSRHEPFPLMTGPVPPLTLLLAPSDAKTTQTTVIHQEAKLRIPKHHLTAEDLPKVPHDSQSMPRTCCACDPDAPTKPWPVLHLIARHHTQPTAHLPPQAYAWVAPWFHRTDANITLAWNPDHNPQWLFTTIPTWPRPDPAGIAICYSMYEPGRTGKHEHPYYPLHHHIGFYDVQKSQNLQQKKKHPFK